MQISETGYDKTEQRILARFAKKTRNSRRLLDRAASVIPGGVNANIKFFAPNPIFMKDASGSRLRDVDGNEYIDYLMCYGALALGHGHTAIKAAVDRAFLSYGTTAFGTPTPLESEYGGVLRDIYHRDGMIRFTNSGLEATLLAIRLAKAFTGKRKVAKFEGHYHGSNDHLLVSYHPDISAAGSGASPRGIPDSADVDETAVAGTVVLPFNDLGATEELIQENAASLSCVIMEPFAEGYIRAEKPFIDSLRGLTRDLRIPLIFDEVKTGFRIRIGGASEFYSVTPDITCLGKIIGGGFPVGAVVGSEEIMVMLDPSQSSRKRVFHSGTFNGNPVSLSAGKATVETLLKNKNFQRMVDRTDQLKGGFDRRLAKAGISHQVLGEGALFSVVFTEGRVRNYRDLQSSNLRLRRMFDFLLLLEGVYLKPLERLSPSLAHTREDVSTTLGSCDAALDALSERLP